MEAIVNPTVVGGFYYFITCICLLPVTEEVDDWKVSLNI
jgi:hypothetical protein